MSLTKIFTRGNLLNNKNGKIILRGVSIADPYRIKNKNKIDILQIIKRLKIINVNVVRIPIQPDYWQAIPNFLREYIDEIVNCCMENNIYCILDWHAIGNPVTGQTRMKDRFIEQKGKRFLTYDSDIKTAKKFWAKASKRYKNYENVIFELFNEPAPDNKEDFTKGLAPLYWTDWKLLVEQLIKIIRANSDNLILISPTKWAYNLKSVAENPVIEKNIAYSIHPYPIHKEWKENFELIVKKYPIVVTEWAFKEETNEDFLRATETNYGNPILEYMEYKGISWVAWCYDFEWGPRMLEKPFEDNIITKWGEFITDKIRKYK